MKKLLISIIGVMLLILLFVCATKGLAIGSIKILSINQLRDNSNSLDQKIQEADIETKQTHADVVAQMDTAIKKLKNAKEEYESKVGYLSEDSEIGITQIEKYKIEYLWGIIGNYAKDDGLRVDMDIEETSIKDTYDINFTLTGSYVGITNFLYHIENDDELNYKVVNFKLEPSGVSSTAETTDNTEETQTDNTASSSSKTNRSTGTVDTSGNTEILKATFKVENIIINFN